MINIIIHFRSAVGIKPFPLQKYDTTMEMNDMISVIPMGVGAASSPQKKISEYVFTKGRVRSAGTISVHIKKKIRKELSGLVMEFANRKVNC